MTTANDIYKAACRLILETPGEDEDLKASFPAFLDVVMLEALPYENSMRRALGLSERTAADVPRVGSADDTDTVLPFDERFLRLAFPYGVVSRFLSDDNSKKAESMIEWNRFVDVLARYTPAVFEGVQNGF